jgi:hypothetical protein
MEYDGCRRVRFSLLGPSGRAGLGDVADRCFVSLARSKNNQIKHKDMMFAGAVGR